MQIKELHANIQTSITYLNASNKMTATVPQPLWVNSERTLNSAVHFVQSHDLRYALLSCPNDVSANFLTVLMVLSVADYAS